MAQQLHLRKSATLPSAGPLCASTIPELDLKNY